MISAAGLKNVEWWPEGNNRICPRSPFSVGNHFLVSVRTCVVMCSGSFEALVDAWRAASHPNQRWHPTEAQVKRPDAGLVAYAGLVAPRFGYSCENITEAARTDPHVSWQPADAAESHKLLQEELQRQGSTTYHYPKDWGSLTCRSQRCGLTGWREEDYYSTNSARTSHGPHDASSRCNANSVEDDFRVLLCVAFKGNVHLESSHSDSVAGGPCVESMQAARRLRGLVFPDECRRGFDGSTRLSQRLGTSQALF